jgi:LmbE family N-acetylglucosaminyl deacetylase
MGKSAESSPAGMFMMLFVICSPGFAVASIGCAYGAYRRREPERALAVVGVSATVCCLAFRGFYLRQ